MVGPEQWFCLFRGDAGPMAVPAESVAEVLEIDRLVRLAWSPPQVDGLCPFHREVIPVIRLASSSRGAESESLCEPDPSTVAHPLSEKPRDGDPIRSIVLILKAGCGAWGVRSDSSWTIMSRECPEYHPPRPYEGGPVVIATILRAGIRYGVLDTEATWQGLRSAINRWYGRIGEPEAVAPSDRGAGRGDSPPQGLEGTGACERLGGSE